jgi:hypothetical protein
MKALGLRLLGEILARQQPVQAEQYFQESLALLEKLEERFEVAWTLRSFANLLCDRGEVERARSLKRNFKNFMLKNETGFETGSCYIGLDQFFFV